ncbi:MAG: hypothetical protein B6D55_04495 [Candidatus Omnitrophica bacterium 4484_70.2]|nr:MAG: hypothetical protein B6D55_04495 [Candidatus Omnitrophica bacterium 4484_70.2]
MFKGYIINKNVNFLLLKMKKICFVIGTLVPGGAEKQLYYLIKYLDRKKFQPVLIALRSGGMENDFREIVKIKVIGKRWKIDPFFFFSLVHSIKEEKVDILHSFMFTSNTWGRFCGILLKIPVIVASERSMDLWKKWYHFKIDKILGNFTKKIICVSEEVKNYYWKRTKLPENKFAVIENGINLEEIERVEYREELREEFGIKEEDFVILTGGRLCKEKSIDVLLTVVPELKNEIKNLKILIVGEGEEKRNLMEIVKKLKTENSVVFTGFRKDILSIIKISDIVVLTSKWEGMPNLILEGMALGKSVISTDIGGSKEIIENGVNGFLLKYGDKKTLVDKILYLYKNHEVRKKMGEEGYKIVKKRFNLFEKIKEYEKIYSSFKI